MRDVLDCGVLLAPGHEAAMRGWVERHSVRATRLRLHPVSLTALRYAPVAAHPHPPALAVAVPEGPDVLALARMAVALTRYDVCILPVAPATLAWTRMALQQARAALNTPLLLLVHEVKAPAIEDLLSLGAWDFMTQPVCLESLRVRLGRLARPAAGRDALREPAAAYGAASAAAAGRCRPGAARQRPSGAPAEHGWAGARHHAHRGALEPFRAAKARVVDGFERDYIRHALSRHGGNVAQAARACSKHRRAFWALMRKHGIEAAPYRQAAQAHRD